jgi:hypothetical protein
LGRWSKPDTVVPNPGDPIAWDRFVYARNNSLKYVESTGHKQVCAAGDEGGGCGYGVWDPLTLEAKFGAYPSTDDELLKNQLLKGYFYKNPGKAEELYNSGAIDNSTYASWAFLAWDANNLRGDSSWPGMHQDGAATLMDAPMGMDTLMGLGAVGTAGGIGKSNPWGRYGSPEHRNVVSSIENDIENIYGPGYHGSYEYKISTLGGMKNVRYADLAVLDPSGEPVAFYQVGRITKGGLPVSRERHAITDIFDLSNYNVPIFYFPYGK